MLGFHCTQLDTTDIPLKFLIVQTFRDSRGAIQSKIPHKSMKDL